MNNNKSRYILLGITLVLLIVQLIILDYSNFWQWKHALRLATPILIMLSLVLSIKSENKQKKNT